uniref:Flowering time control protein FPA n=1 Tax=Anthurium amnicola TaxID=1678845 RepID=A0A1D1XCC8_9ARAE
MMGRVGGGRERHRGEHPPRVEEKGGGGGGGGHQQGRPEAPPSRHLWVGNLSHHVTHSTLLEQFLRFGDLENISFIPGRSYAFVNFKNEDDAIFALRTLRGQMLAGAPIKIEFQKGDKNYAPSLDGEYNRDERNSMERGESFQQRDSRLQIHSPGKTYFDKPKGGNNEEPSEVLWIGFPAHLNVDKMVLEGAFSPFGEILKITTFPGRSYAFVRYRSIVAACLAKEALQGRLFNNPRVSICFARSDIGPPEQGRGLVNPKLNIHGLSRPVHSVRRDRNFETSVGELPMLSSRDFLDVDKIPGDIEAMGFGRNNSVGMSMGPVPTVGTFEHPRYQNLGSERRIAEDQFEHYISPAAEKDSLRHDFHIERPRRGPLEDSWDMDADAFPLAKKIRMDSFPDRELPEYPFSDLEKKRHLGLPKISLPEQKPYNKGLEFDFGSKEVPDHLNNLSYLNVEINDSWGHSDSFGASSGLLHTKTKSDKWRKFTPEPEQIPLNEWKWEGTIAKGGTPICRARCFPVGKALDFMLPEFLDCTARTGLDMLARHFYQASSSWVVFFVPESDADIVFYNEFMHYLGEKDRAAVAKLGEKTTLFLVPPSEFSEKVLKVPGKVSISGVILRFQQSSSNFGSIQNPTERIESDVSLVPRSANETNIHDDELHQKPVSPDLRSSSKRLNYFSSLAENFVPTAAFSALQRPSSSLSYSGRDLELGKVPDSRGEGRYDVLQKANQSVPPNWSPLHERAPNSGFGILSSTTMGYHSSNNPVVEIRSLSERNVMQTKRSSLLESGTSSIVTAHDSKSPPPGAKPPLPSTAPGPTLQPEHLAQLAAFLGQQKHLGQDPPLALSGDQRHLTPMQKPIMHDHSSSSNSLVPQLSHMQQFHQHASSPPAAPDMGKLEQQSNQAAQSSSREDPEADPQKRLQATLQLAAALLQQIQQQSKADN